MYIRLERFYYLSTAFGPLLIALLLYLDITPRYIFIFLMLLFVLLFSMFYAGFRDKTSITPGVSDSKAGQAQTVFGNVGNGIGDTGMGSFAGSKPHCDKAIQLPQKVKLHKKIAGFFTPTVIFANLSLTFFGGVMVGTSAWLTTYFTSLNIAVSLSSIFVAVFWFATFLGLQIMSKIVDKIKEEKILFYGGIISSVSLISFSFINIISIKVFFLILVGMSLSGIYPLCGAITIRANPKSAGTSSGITIAMGLAGGLIVSPVMGFVAQYLSKSYVPYVLVILAVLGTILSAVLLKISPDKSQSAAKV
jgi:MFS family permease